MLSHHFLISSTIYPVFSFTNPHSHLAPVVTLVATFFAPSFSYPDSYFSWIFFKPFSPKDLVLLPRQSAFSLADSKSSSGLISAKGISSLQTYLPTSGVGWMPISLPSSTPRQQAAALEVILVLNSAFQSPYTARNFAKLSLPPLSILSTSYGVHQSRVTLLTLVTKASCLNWAAQLRQMKMA